MAAATTQLRRRSFGGWHVYGAAGELLGWVVKHGDTWHAYVVRRDDRLAGGREVGWGFTNRREAVDEVWIQREV